MYIVKTSVRNLVESVLMTGDIGSEDMILDPERAEAGSIAHRTHQGNMEKIDDRYKKEYFLKNEYTVGELTVHIEGRADGVVPWEFIEEIKSTYRNVDEIEKDDVPVHWAQLKFYGHMAMMLNNLDSINLRLTYFNLDDRRTVSFEEKFTLYELTAFTEEILEKYARFRMLYFRWMEERNSSIGSVDFPFPNYRKGQREMAKAVYGTIRENRRIFIQAPTGIGKTISTVFPSVKALKEGKTDRIFYLTPRSTGKALCEEAVEILRGRGAKIRSVTITSKEKSCFKDEVRCDAKVCEYAKGHYDRISDALYDILTHETFIRRETIEAYARKHMVCPFEFNLDLTLYSDIIICDYNYAFDPRVYLRRFFEEKNEKYVFLIDEAHNLLDRAREMFSAELTREPFKKLKKEMKEYSKRIKKAASGVDKVLSELGKASEETEGRMVSKEIIPDVSDRIYEFTDAFHEFNEDGRYKADRERLKENDPELEKLLLDTFFDCITYRRVEEIYSEGHITYIEKNGAETHLKMFCIDPSGNLKNAMERSDSQVLFSATLSPMDYYIEIYGGDINDYRMMIDSPFPKENLSVYFDVATETRYSKRKDTYEDVAKNIRVMAQSRKGNYIAFFPSYRYMNDVYEIFEERYGLLFDVKKQESNLTEEEREEVLEEFSEDRENTMVYFMVMGGVFSEGIDLKGDRLIGTAIVGVGYPTFDFERTLIQNFFNEKGREGFRFAYTYPGLNRISQAGGRVIRSEEDKGMILLIDARYRDPEIRKLLPQNWGPLINISCLEKEEKENGC